MKFSLKKTQTEINIFTYNILFLFFLEDLDRTLAEYEYGSVSEAYVSISKQHMENIPSGSTSLRIK